MKAKLKTYVLMLAKQFPAHHYRKGDSTQFYGKCLDGAKIHTIRINAELWKKRIDEVNAGRAIISVRDWTEKPYASPQQELFKMRKCGYEFIKKGENYIVSDPAGISFFHAALDHGLIQKNDGLTIDEFNSWFKKIDTSDDLIIIHFTDFRYSDIPYNVVRSYLIPTQNPVTA